MTTEADLVTSSRSPIVLTTNRVKVLDWRDANPWKEGPGTKTQVGRLWVWISVPANYFIAKSHLNWSDNGISKIYDYELSDALIVSRVHMSGLPWIQQKIIKIEILGTLPSPTKVNLLQRHELFQTSKFFKNFHQNVAANQPSGENRLLVQSNSREEGGGGDGGTYDTIKICSKAFLNIHRLIAGPKKLFARFK